MEVSFHSEPDPAPKKIERACYRRALDLGIEVGPALSLDDVLSRIKAGWVPTVLYDTAEGVGHLSPLLGRVGKSLLL